MKRLLFSFLISSLLLFQIAFASDFSLNFDKDGTNLDVKQLANYPFYATKTGYIDITINNPSQEGWFTVALWGVPIEWVTVENSVIKIPVLSKGVVRLVVKPSRDAIPNIYKYFLKVTRLSSGDTEERELLVNVIQVTSAILKDVSLSCKSCLDKVDVSGKVINVGSRNLDLSLVFKYGDRQKTVNIGKLGANENRDFQTTLDLKDLSPKDYSVDVLLVDVNGNLFYTESMPFSIPVTENVIYDKKVSSTPFGSIITVTATNLGNIASEADMRSVSPNNWYTVISGPNPTGMMTGYYFWKTTLNPKESISVNYSEIYWPSYVLVVTIILGLVFVYWQSTAFTFSKVIIGKPSLKSGKDVSISLHLKSRRKSIDRVAVRDVVPSNFSIVSKFETVKPLIRKVTDGIELIWKLGGLSPNEERVLHYTIRPSTEISRKVNLPPALAKAVSGKGLALKYSNKVSLYPEKEPARIVMVRIAK